MPYRNQIRQLITAVNALDGIYYELSKVCGIKDNTLCLLYALDDGAAHTQTQICREWLIPKTTLNTVVRECVQAGYLEKESCGRDKYLKLTPTGAAYARQILAPIYQAEEAAMEQTLHSFSPAFIEAFQVFAASMEQACENHLFGDLS